MNKIIIAIKTKYFYSFLIILFFVQQSCTTIDYKENRIQSKLDGLQEKTAINLVTYNIKAIYEKSESEITNLLKFINGNDFDFVVLQELFDESTRDAISNNSDTTKFQTIISRVDYNSFPEFIFQDAGLFMMGRFPRVDLTSLDFGDDIETSNGVIHMLLDKEMSRTNDFLANKSVLGSLFSINDSTCLFLFTAHVQAAGTTEHKEFQLSQIKNFIKISVIEVLSSGILKSSKDLIVILAGDFNSNAYSVDRFKRLTNILGYPRDLHKEFNGAKEEFTFRGTRRYDYIFAYDSLATNTFKKVKVKSIKINDVVDDEGKSISDHKAIESSIIIN